MEEYTWVTAAGAHWRKIETEYNDRWAKMAELDGPGFSVWDRIEAKRDLEHFARSSSHGVENSIRKTPTKPCSRMADYAKEIQESCARILKLLREEIDATDSTNDALSNSDETLLSMEPLEKHLVTNAANSSIEVVQQPCQLQEAIDDSQEAIDDSESVTSIETPCCIDDLNTNVVVDYVIDPAYVLPLDNEEENPKLQSQLFAGNEVSEISKFVIDVIPCDASDSVVDPKSGFVEDTTALSTGFVQERKAIESASIQTLYDAHYVFEEMTLSGICHFSLIMGSIHFKPWDPGTNKALESGISTLNLILFLLEDNTFLGNKGEWLHELYVPQYYCFFNIWYAVPSLLRPHFNYKPPNISACYLHLKELLYVGDELDLKYDALLSKSTLISCNNTCLITCLYLVPFYENNITRGFHLDQIGSLHHVKRSTSGYNSYVMVSIGGGGDGNTSRRENMLFVVILVILALNDTQFQPLNCYTVLFLIGFRTEFYTCQGYNHVHEWIQLVGIVELLEYCCFKLCLGVAFSIGLKYGLLTISSLECVEIVKWGSREILCDTSNGVLALLENSVPVYNRFQEQLWGVLIHVEVHEIGSITCAYEQLSFLNLCFKFGDVAATLQIICALSLHITKLTQQYLKELAKSIEKNYVNVALIENILQLSNVTPEPYQVHFLSSMNVLSLDDTLIIVGLISLSITINLIVIEGLPFVVTMSLAFDCEKRVLLLLSNTSYNEKRREYNLASIIEACVHLVGLLINGVMKLVELLHSHLEYVTLHFLSHIKKMTQSGSFCVSIGNEVAVVVDLASNAMLHRGHIFLDITSQQRGLNDLLQQAQIFLYTSGDALPSISLDMVNSLLREWLFNPSSTKAVAVVSVSVTVCACVIKNNVIAAVNWLAARLRQFYYPSHHVGRKNWDPGEAGCLTHTKGSLQFKQWDPGGCSLIYWKVTLQMEVTWNEAIITQKHGPNSNLEDKVDFNGGGNVMIQLAKTSQISKWRIFVVTISKKGGVCSKKHEIYIYIGCN